MRSVPNKKINFLGGQGIGGQTSTKRPRQKIKSIDSSLKKVLICVKIKKLNVFLTFGGIMKKHIILFLIFIFSFCFIYPEKPLTVAEKSNYTATSRVKDVFNFFYKLQETFPNKILVSTIGKTFEGREIPLVIVSNQVPLNPCFNQKPVIMINANIHAGEIEGKEAVQMFVRDMLYKNSPLLDKFTFVITPVFNVDGNEKISQKHRPYQRVKEGVGIRYNGMNMDLNRDFVKLKSPEAKALVKTFNMWHPLVFVDMHTTDGSFHEEPLTFTWCMSPYSSKKMMDYSREKIYPFIRKYVAKKYKMGCIPYGHFDNRTAPKKWNGFFGGMLYATGYFGVKGAFSFLDENYAYADYKTRVKAAYAFLDALTSFVSNEENLNRMIALQQEFYNRENPYIFTEFKPKSVGKIIIKGYRVFKDKETGRFKPDKSKRVDYKVDFIGDYEGKKVELKGGFIFPSGLKPILKKLKEHGISVFKVVKDVELKAKRYKIDKISFYDFPFQGMLFVKDLKGHFEEFTLNAKKGFYVVPLNANQTFRQVASALLYPESKDSLLKEGFFNLLIFPSQWSKKPGYYPVYMIDSINGIELKLLEK